jgi:hypothetical protein
MVKIDFSFESEHGTFADAIILPDDHTFTDAGIETIKQDRLNNWIAAVTATSSDVIDVEVTDITSSEE